MLQFTFQSLFLFSRSCQISWFHYCILSYLLNSVFFVFIIPLCLNVLLLSRIVISYDTNKAV